MKSDTDTFFCDYSTRISEKTKVGIVHTVVKAATGVEQDCNAGGFKPSVAALGDILATAVRH